MSESIVVASGLDLPQVLSLYAECVGHVQASRGGYWHSRYPGRELIIKGVREGTTWVVKKDGGIVAAAVLDEKQAEEYAKVPWRFSGKAACIHRMAVHPAHQGKGMASLLHGFLEDEARSIGFTCMRVDTWAENSQVKRMLERRGFVMAGTVSYPRTPLLFHCYEKKL